MSIRRPGGRGGTIQNWVKGESGNPRGSERKYVSKLVGFGYSLPEINQTIQNILSMKASEIDSVENNPDATVLEKIISRALQNSVKDGGLKPIEKMINRAFGTPFETPQEIKKEADEYDNLSNDEIAQRFRAALNESKSNSKTPSRSKKNSAETVS